MRLSFIPVSYTHLWCSDLYLMRWINPLVTVFSNDFNNTLFYRLAAYSRLLWLLIFSACLLYTSSYPFILCGTLESAGGCLHDLYGSAHALPIAHGTLFERVFADLCHRAVSYTHLDVYKRQHFAKGIF